MEAAREELGWPASALMRQIGRPGDGAGRSRHRPIRVRARSLVLGVAPALEPVAALPPGTLRGGVVRRHLSESQRAMIAARIATLADGQRADLVEGLPIGRASEMLNVSERSTHRAREVIDHGAPNIVTAVERGEVSAARVLRAIRC